MGAKTSMLRGSRVGGEPGQKDELKGCTDVRDARTVGSLSGYSGGRAHPWLGEVGSLLA
jgi:hypothetical protein